MHAWVGCVYDDWVMMKFRLAFRGYGDWGGGGTERHARW